MEKQDYQTYMTPGAYEALVSEAGALLRAGETAEGVVDRLLPMIASSLEEGRKARHKEAQANGIRRAREAGVPLGRRPTPLPANFPDVVRLYREGAITSDAAAKLCRMAKSTFFFRMKEYEEAKRALRADEREPALK